MGEVALSSASESGDWSYTHDVVSEGTAETFADVSLRSSPPTREELPVLGAMFSVTNVVRIGYWLYGVVRGGSCADGGRYIGPPKAIPGGLGKR